MLKNVLEYNVSPFTSGGFLHTPRQWNNIVFKGNFPKKKKKTNAKTTII